MTQDDWTWNAEKNRSNQAKHGVSFELAVRAFDDPLHVTVADPCDHEERWRTFGQIQTVLILVVHTDPIWRDGVLLERGRIISARKATSNERKLFEDRVYGC